MKRFLILLALVTLLAFQNAKPSEKGMVVEGTIGAMDSIPLNEISVRVIQYRAWILWMREEVLYTGQLNADGTFRTPPLKHRSSWSLGVQIASPSRHQRHGQQSFWLVHDESQLSRRGWNARGIVSANAKLIPKLIDGKISYISRTFNPATDETENESNQ